MNIGKPALSRSAFAERSDEGFESLAWCLSAKPTARRSARARQAAGVFVRGAHAFAAFLEYVRPQLSSAYLIGWDVCLCYSRSYLAGGAPRVFHDRCSRSLRVKYTGSALILWYVRLFATLNNGE